MLDVHPPEHPAHSWTDFFIHMGTICLGLLIAIGLEQSVEWLHKRSERIELQDAIREDLGQTIRDTETTEVAIQHEREWARAVVSAASDAADHHTALVVPALPTFQGAIDPFQDPSFRAAKANAQLTLLPFSQVRPLSSLDGLVDIEERFFEAQQQAVRLRDEFDARFGPPGMQPNSWSKAPPSELARYIQVISQWEGSLRNMEFINREGHDKASELLRDQFASAPK